MGRLFPPRDKSRRPLPVTEHWVQWRLTDAQWIATARKRLQECDGWFGNAMPGRPRLFVHPSHAVVGSARNPKRLTIARKVDQKLQMFN